MQTEPAAWKSNQVLIWLVGAILLVTPLIQWGTLADAAALPRYAFLAISTTSILLGWSFISLKNKTVICIPPLFLLMATYLCWAAISYTWSIDPAATLQSWFYLLIFTILVFLVIQILADTDNLKILITLSVIAGTLVSLIGLLQVLGLEPFQLRQRNIPASTFVNKNQAAQYMDFVVPLALLLFIQTEQKARVWLVSLALGINIAFLLSTYSRGSWLALSVSFLVLVVVVYKNSNTRKLVFSRLSNRRLQALTAIAIPIIFLSLPTGQTDISLEEKLTLNSSVDIRLKSYANAGAAIIDKPGTGLGYGAFMLGFRNYMFATAPLTETTENLYLINLHNDFLQEFAELGILGGLLFLIFYLWLLKLAWQETRQTSSTGLYAVGILMALVAFGTHALFSFPLHRPAAAMEFWVLAGIVMALGNKKIRLSKSTSRTGRIFLLFTAPLLLIYSLFYFSNYLHNSSQLLLMKGELNEMNCPMALNTAGNINHSQSHYTKILVPLAYNLCHTTDPEGSFSRLNEIIAYDPNSSIARITRGTLYLNRNQSSLAADDFLNVVTILPHRPTAYVGLGHSAVQTGNVDLAIQMYQKALSLDNKNQTAREMLEKLDQVQKKPEDAVIE